MSPNGALKSTWSLQVKLGHVTLDRAICVCKRNAAIAAHMASLIRIENTGQCTSTPRGFEPLRAEPNGFRVHLLNRSDTVSLIGLGFGSGYGFFLQRDVPPMRVVANIGATCQSNRMSHMKVHIDTVSERLRRWTRNPLGSARRGSNPLGVVFCAR